MNIRTSKRKLNRQTVPRPLVVGDTVALIRPASKLEDEKYERAVKTFQRLGFFVVQYPGRVKSHAFFAASDEDRANELMWAFEQPAIKAVFSCRGGYGSMRLLPHIKEASIRKWKPKIFVGYSDITFLHHWIINRFGWPCFHGALVGQVKAEEIESLISRIVALSGLKRETWSECKVFRKGKGMGRLVGGNLSMLQVNGPAALPREKLVLVLEDVNEANYRIDRMLWNLIYAGYDRFVEAVILGRFHLCGRNDVNEFKFKWIMETVQKLCPRGPILTNAHFGHGPGPQRLLPLGSTVGVKGKELSWQASLVRN